MRAARTWIPVAADGMTEDAIASDFPQLSPADIREGVAT